MKKVPVSPEELDAEKVETASEPKPTKIAVVFSDPYYAGVTDGLLLACVFVVFAGLTISVLENLTDSG